MGKYSSRRGTKTCSTCPKARPTSSSGAKTSMQCKACPAGYYSDPRYLQNCMPKSRCGSYFSTCLSFLAKIKPAYYGDPCGPCRPNGYNCGKSASQSFKKCYDSLPKREANTLSLKLGAYAEGKLGVSATGGKTLLDLYRSRYQLPERR